MPIVSLLLREIHGSTQMKCHEVMSHNVEYCAPNEPIREVAELMRARDVGCIPVADLDSKELCGIITDRDIVLRVIDEDRDPWTTSASDIMTRQPITCTTDTELYEAISLMGAYRLHRIPIVDQLGKLVGIISLTDIATRVENPATTADLVRSISLSSKHVRTS